MSTSSTSQRPIRMSVPMKDATASKADITPQSSGQQFAAKVVGAAFSNSYASVVTNPFDVIKVRQQLRLKAAGGSVTAGGNTFWNVGREMVQAEGVKSLMHGVTATIMREVLYSSFRLGCYEFFKDRIYDASARTLSKDGITIKLVAASLGAAIGSIIANPTDLAKTRMQQAYPSGKLPYRHTFDAFAALYREGVVASTTGRSAVAGLRALWRGVDATTYRGIIVSASQISSYDQIKQSLKRRGIFEEGLPLHMVASIFAGFVSSAASNPIDVIKVRIHNDKERRYRGVLHCIQSTMRNEGPAAFYKGFSMCWARIGVHTVLTFLAFERMRVWLGIKPM